MKPRARRALAAASAAALALSCITVFDVACNGEFRFDEAAADSGLDSGNADDGGGDDGGGSTDASGTGDGRVPACTDDSDCEKWGLKCDVFGGVCVQCDEDEHCSGATPRCDTAIHRCVECGTAKDCGDAGYCESHTRRCVRTCEDLNPCPNGLTCNDVLDRCQQCTADSTCQALNAQTPHCDPDLLKCVQCAMDSQCSGVTPRCDRTRGLCVECYRSDQCPTARPLCNAAGFCFAP